MLRTTKPQLPDDLDYQQVTALSFEVRQKLTRHRQRARWGRPRHVGHDTGRRLPCLLAGAPEERPLPWLRGCRGAAAARPSEAA